MDGVSGRVKYPNYLDSMIQRYIVDAIGVIWKQTKADHQIVTPGPNVRVTAEHYDLPDQFVDGFVGEVTTIAGNEQPYFVEIVICSIGYVGVVKLRDLHRVSDDSRQAVPALAPLCLRQRFENLPQFLV